MHHHDSYRFVARTSLCRQCFGSCLVDSNKIDAKKSRKIMVSTIDKLSAFNISNEQEMPCLRLVRPLYRACHINNRHLILKTPLRQQSVTRTCVPCIGALHCARKCFWVCGKPWIWQTDLQY